MALSNTEANRRYRERLKEKGLCVNCRNPLEREGVLCDECKKQHASEMRKTREFYKQYGLCPRCGKNKLFGDEKVCLECSAKGYAYSMKNRRKKGKENYNKYQAELSRKTYKMRNENGICTRCGKKNADYGYKTCGICREKLRKYRRENYVHKQDEWVKNGLCFFCGDAVKKGYKVCEKHYAINLKNLNNPKCKEATEKIKKSNNIFYVKK